MEFFNILIKSLGAIISLFIFTKFMGKKQISQLNLFDYVIGITIGSVVADVSIDLETHFMHGIIVMAVFTLVSILISYLSQKSIKARRLLVGVPIILIENGKIIGDNLKSIKFDINDFLQEARISGYYDISELEYAIMEPNGKVSFLPKTKYKPLTPNDMKIKSNYKGLCSNVIIDGKIMFNNLAIINKDEKWLIKRLDNMGYKNIEDLFLVTIDSDEVIKVYEKGIKSKMEGSFI